MGLAPNEEYLVEMVKRTQQTIDNLQTKQFR